MTFVRPSSNKMFFFLLMIEKTTLVNRPTSLLYSKVKINVATLSAWLKTTLKGHEVFHSLYLVQKIITSGAPTVIWQLPGEKEKVLVASNLLPHISGSRRSFYNLISGSERK